MKSRSWSGISVGQGAEFSSRDMRKIIGGPSRHHPTSRQPIKQNMRYHGLRRSCLEADPGFSFSSSSRPDDTVENQDKTEIGRRFPPVTPIAKKDKQKEKSTKGEPLKNRLRERSSRKQKKGISFKQRYAIRNNGKAKAYRRRFLVCFCFLLLFFFFRIFFFPSIPYGRVLGGKPRLGAK